MGELYRHLEEYRESDYYPFHMPGHKRSAESADGILAKTYSLDITEIDGFDNLHQPNGILKEEQERAAKLFGSEKTFFLVNGSTGGILSAISAGVRKGGRILMARNCHKSVYHGVYLNGLEVSYLYPDIWGICGIAADISPESVEKSLREQPGIEAVMITSPTYEGIVSDIRSIADIAHKYGKPLIVDEAHGAHFGFYEGYPESAVKQGADIIIQSLHKTLPSMTQTALLHINGEYIDKDRLERYLRIYQTSSPSYVLMASISSCLDMLEKEGEKRLARVKEYRDRLAEELNGCSYIRIGKTEFSMQGRKVYADPCKLVIFTAGRELTGLQLYNILKERYHLQMEMAEGNYALAILSMMDGKEGLDRLSHALLEIDKDIFAGNMAISGTGKKGQMHLKADRKKNTVMPIWQAYDGEAENVRIQECGGKIVAEFINLYPPGIPLAVPGERLDKEIIRLLLAYHEAHFSIQGVENGYIKVLKGQ